MLIDILVQTESVMTFSFLTAALCLAYGYKRRRPPAFAAVLGFIALYALVFKPIEMFTDNFYIYLLSLFGIALGFTLLFQKGPLLCRLHFIFNYIYVIVTVKSLLVLIFSSRTVYVEGQSALSLFHYAVFYGLLLLCLFYFVRFLLHPAWKLPIHFWGLTIVTSAASCMVVQLMVETMNRIEMYYSVSVALIMMIFLLLLLLYYVSYLMLDIAQRVIQAELANQRLKLQAEQAGRVSALTQQVRKEKHELKNTYFYIRSLCTSRQYDELERYLNTELNYRFNTLEEFSTGNRIIDEVLTLKVGEAKSHGIQVVTDVLLPPELPFRDEDISALLINLLDNAIDASIKEDQKDIHIKINVVKGYFHVLIKNRVRGDIIKNNPALHTTKADSNRHGIGLMVVRSIVEKYDGMQRFYMDSDYFTTESFLTLSGLEQN